MWRSLCNSPASRTRTARRYTGGDIVRTTNTEADYTKTYAVEWKGAGYFTPIEYDYLPSLDHENFEHEVIGNIYENPELLK